MECLYDIKPHSTKISPPKWQAENKISEYDLCDTEKSFDPSDNIDQTGQLQNAAYDNRDKDDRQQTSEARGLFLRSVVIGMRVIRELAFRLQIGSISVDQITNAGGKAFRNRTGITKVLSLFYRHIKSLRKKTVICRNI